MPVAHSDSQLPDHIADLLLALLSDPQSSYGAAFAALDEHARAQLVAAAREQRVLAPLSHALNTTGHPPCVTTGLDTRAAMARALALQAEALRLHQMLKSAGIPHRFLKGIALAEQIYPALWVRPMRDMDILLHPEDLPRAHALLAAQGGIIERYAHKSATPSPDAKHLPPLWSPQRLIGVELHGQAIGTGCGLDASARAHLNAALWQGDSNHGRLPAPDPAPMLVHMVVHAVHDHELNNGPILICDMRHLLASRKLDPRKVTSLVDQLGIAPAFALALSLLPRACVEQAGLAHMLRPDLRICPPMARALLLQDADRRNDLRLAADLAQRGVHGRLRLVLKRVFFSRWQMLDRWKMEGHSTPPPALPILWLWFVLLRSRQMRTRHTRVTGFDPRDHLLNLRALRDASQ